MVRLGVVLFLMGVLAGCDALIKPDVEVRGEKETIPSIDAVVDNRLELQAALGEAQKACAADKRKDQSDFEELLMKCKSDPSRLPSGMALIGQVEYADILPLGVRQKARIDTGAETTSVGAVNIEVFERDERKWVMFDITLRGSDEVISFKKPLVRTASIKRHNADNVQRPVVELMIAIGELKQRVEVTLADRSSFEFPVLIGRNFLDGRAAVDVSEKFLALE